VEIYIASFAGLLSSLLLAVVYLADRYEPEPIELIQDSFLTGLAGQLVLIFLVSSIDGQLMWSGAWMIVTVICAAAYLPFRLHRQAEMDERFDGIVYSVALVGGATCVVHLNNLPGVIAASPYRDALAPGAEPDLRDMLILTGSPGIAGELGLGLVAIMAAILVGAALGMLQMRGWSPWRTAVVCVAVGSAVVGVDLLAGGGWWVRGVLVVTALAVALAVKRRSVFKDRPEPREREVLLMGLKMVLVVFGAALLSMVLLQAVVEQPSVEDELVGGGHHTTDAGPEPAQ
jgi:Ca2+/Na+ antiporter